MKWNHVQVISAILITGLACMVAQAASVSRADIPAGGNWYLHLNLDLMKRSEVGRMLMQGTVDETLDDYQKELGVDIRKEIQGITLFGAKLPEGRNLPDDGTVIFHGKVGSETRQALLSALQRRGAEVSAFNSAGLSGYKVVVGDGKMTYTDADGQVKDLPWGHGGDLYFSFGENQALVTHNRDMMQTFLDAGGHLGGFEGIDAEPLPVLQSERALLQGGANTLAGFGGAWDSSALMNVNDMALVIAEDQDGLQLSAQLTANPPEMVVPVSYILESLVALKAMDQSEIVLGEILRQVRFESEGAVLHMNVPITASQVEALRNR